MRFEMLVLRTLFAAVLLTTALLFGSMLLSHAPDMRMAADGTSTSSVSSVSATTLSLAVQGVCPVLADGVICPKAD